MGKRKTKEEFIQDSILKHGNLYNYDDVVYVNNKVAVWIKCNSKNHRFLQRPDRHIRGDGCAKCSGSYKKSNDEILKELHLIHGNKYEYPNFNYTDNKQKIKIYCKEHKHDFTINYKSHHSGVGCKKCKIEKYIPLFKQIHGEKYDYTLSEYNGANRNITIVCPIHGNFEQNPFYHLDGCGCQKCGIFTSSGEQHIEQYLKTNHINYISQHRFIDCKFKNTLPFDFFIPSLNIAIEFDGEQHSQIVEFFGGEQEFIKQKKKDKIKDDYCEINKIKLIRISKKDCEKNGYSVIEEKLNGVFNGI